MAAKGAPKSVQELELILSGDNKVKVAVDGVLRGKFISKSKFLSVAKDGFGFCSVIFGWDIHDTVYPKELLISNRNNGYRDLLAAIDLSTYRRIPWENDVPFFLLYFLDPETKKPISVDPRGTLRKAVSQVEAKGWQCISGIEFEYFQFQETPYSVVEKKYVDLKPLTPGMHGYSLLRPSLNNEYFHDLFDVSLKMGVDIEGHHTETGPGVFETALAYTTALRVADNATLFKLIAKSIGIRRNILPSFMAKPWANLPGCSGHIHVSLKDTSGKNVFSLSPDEIKQGGRKDARYEDVQFISQEGEWFISGLLDGLPHVVPLLVPTINGYKRLAGGEAFWAPNKLTYGYDSRAASIRVISPPSCSPSATRLEIRIPGADVQPHYALSAIFLLGLRGINKKLVLPFPPVSQQQAQGDEAQVVKLPTSLKDATEKMMQPGSIAREILGNEFVDHFGGTRLHEVNVWDSAVTNWEREFHLQILGFKVLIVF
ncbi:glutamine synthetase/guanido kinase [Cantharellus anzutake]|uniref:glutamine synthetase/guanido kinase n=1 Tax=Cantharellus anzutake TaxID=1750568 RepID=UPI001905DA30|nr:glutamine synthetase/guanido kinase [Cantharellus anzutake]KAF8334260.1 glutamine synthetase/guanido kinase [Cantharellus anzutake]